MAKGLGDGSPGSKAAVKQITKIDLSGATDVSNISAQPTLRPSPSSAPKFPSTSRRP